MNMRYQLFFEKLYFLGSILYNFISICYANDIANPRPYAERGNEWYNILYKAGFYETP